MFKIKCTLNYNIYHNHIYLAFIVLKTEGKELLPDNFNLISIERNRSLTFIQFFTLLLYFNCNIRRVANIVGYILYLLVHLTKNLVIQKYIFITVLICYYHNITTTCVGKVDKEGPV